LGAEPSRVIHYGRGGGTLGHQHPVPTSPKLAVLPQLGPHWFQQNFLFLFHEFVFQISIPDPGRAHGPFFIAKDFLTPTYFYKLFFSPRVIFHFHGIIPKTPIYEKKKTQINRRQTQADYIDSRIYSMIYSTTTAYCTSVYTTHINGTHTHTSILHFIYKDSSTDILYTVHNLYRWTVLLCIHLYTAEPLDTTYTHLWCTHYAWISCTDYTVVQSLCTCKNQQSALFPSKLLLKLLITSWEYSSCLPWEYPTLNCLRTVRSPPPLTQAEICDANVVELP
jgi:hypothetical protein